MNSRIRLLAVAALAVSAAATACAHRPPAEGPRPGAKPAARIEFDSSSGDIFYVPAMIPAGYTRLEATWRGRDLFVIARPEQGKRKVFWKLIPPYVNFQVRNRIGTEYFGAGKRTISIAVMDDGSEVALVAVAGSRRVEPRPDSMLGKFFAEQVKDAMSGGGQEKALPSDVKEHELSPEPAASATPAPTPDEHPAAPAPTISPTP